MAKIGKVEKVTKMLKMSIFFNISQEELKKNGYLNNSFHNNTPF